MGLAVSRDRRIYSKAQLFPVQCLKTGVLLPVSDAMRSRVTAEFLEECENSTGFFLLLLMQLV